LAVELIDRGRVVCEVGEEGVVSPVGPERSLGRVGEAGAAHDESPTPVNAFGDLGLAVGRVGRVSDRLCK
jgi:hypothetical protein